MKLSLDELFKLFEEVENSTLLERPEGSVRTQTGEQKTIKIPRLFISEDWGDVGSGDREELDKAISMAIGGKQSTDPFETITLLENGLADLEEKILKKVSADSPGRVLGQLVVVDTINRLFNSFQSSPLGFVNEAFVSALYGGEQIKLNRVPREEEEESGELSNQIGDVMTGDGIPVSVKTLVPDGTVGGSWKNLVDSFNKQPEEKKKIYFDIFTKKTDDNKKVLGFEAFRFEINPDNIERISDGRVQKIRRKDEGGKEVESLVLREELLSEDLESKTNSDIDLLPKVIEELRKNKWIPEENVSWYLVNVQISIQNIKKYLDVGSEQSLRNQSKKLKPQALVAYAVKEGIISEQEVESFKSSLNTAYAEAEKTKELSRDVKLKGKETQFKLPATDWKALVRQQEGKGARYASLDFSKQRIEGLVRESLTLLGESIVNLFNEVENFSKLVDQYLSSTDSNRGDIGQAAIQSAEQIKPSTEEVVK